LPSVDSSTTITGVNFASDITAVFTGADNTVRNAKSVTRNSATELVVVRPDNMPTDGGRGSYTLTLTNPGVDSPSKNGFNTVNVTTTANPTWSTSAGALANMVRTSPYNVTLSASSTSSITYSIISGALPAGLSFNSGNGVISGTPITSNGSPYTITVRATIEGSARADRTFTISQVVPDVPLNPVATASRSGSGVAYNNSAVSVAFAAPVDGPAPTSYTVYASSGDYSATGATSPIVVTLGVPGTYTFTVKANNAAGQSFATSASNSVTTTTVPDQVAKPSVGGNGVGSVTISWSAPAATGGSAITSYTLIDEGQGNAETNVGLVTSYNSAESEGSNHTYKVKAVNANGTGLASISSDNITTQSFSFAPYGFFGFFSFFRFFSYDSLYFDTKVLTPDGLKPAESLQVGDKLLALDIENTVPLNDVDEKLSWTEWFSDTENLKKHNIIETTVTQIDTRARPDYITIDGSLFTDTHRILVRKDNVVSFIPAADVDTTYQRYSPTDKEFVDIVLVEDIVLIEDALSYSIKCAPYNNFFTENMLVFDKWSG
jgi:hypothetical protein